MIAPRIAFLFVAAAILAGCAIPVRTDPAVEDRVAIRGEMFSPDRIALPPNSEAVVELRETDAAPAPLVAEQRRQLDGRQLPIPFELSVDSSALKSRTRYVFRGAIVSTPGPVRATEPVEIKARAGVVELGSLRLRPVEQIAFGTPYLCGDAPVVFGALGMHERMIVRGEAFDLKPAVSASGDLYDALDGTDTRFWSKGDRAVVTVRGVDLPQCRAVVEPRLPFTARGQEPGWMIRIDANEIFLNADFGALQLRLPRTEPQVTADGILYRTAANGRRLSVSIQPRICADTMTGMPHPYRVSYELDGGEMRSGCGGDPKTLLSGGEWAVESIGAKPVIADSSVTILFLEEDRVAGNASCNRFIGGYRLTGEGLSFPSPLGSTMMACEEPLSEQEARFLGLLQDTYRFEIDSEGRLVLHTTRQEQIAARR